MSLYAKIKTGCKNVNVSKIRRNAPNIRRGIAIVIGIGRRLRFALGISALSMRDNVWLWYMNRRTGQHLGTGKYVKGNTNPKNT